MRNQIIVVCLQASGNNDPSSICPPYWAKKLFFFFCFPYLPDKPIGPCNDFTLPQNLGLASFLKWRVR